MRNPRVGYRYAKALVDLAQEKNQLDEVKKDLDFIKSNKNVELNAVMSSQVVRGPLKSKIFKAIYHGKITELTEAFFNLVFNKGREFAIRDISDAFDEQYNEIKGIVNATITTAVPVDEELRHELYRRIANLPRFTGKTVNLDVKTDPQLIGGFILQVSDNKFDASIRHDLAVIKLDFIQNLYKIK